jgi:hypothetical protein
VLNYGMLRKANDHGTGQAVACCVKGGRLNPTVPQSAPGVNFGTKGLIKHSGNFAFDSLPFLPCEQGLSNPT